MMIRRVSGDRTASGRVALPHPLRRWWLGAVAVALVLGSGACEPQPIGVFRIGVFILDEDPFRDSSGIPTSEGAHLYVDSINRGGGISVGGRAYRVELVEARHPLQVEEVTTAARRLISEERVDALVGPQLSDHAIPVGGIAEHVPIPMISPMSSNPATTRGREFVFRIAFQDDQQARTLAQIAWNQPDGIRHAGVLFDRTSDYSRGITETFVQAFESLGGTTTVLDFPGRAVEDYRPWLSELRDAGVEALLLPNVPSTAVRIVEQIPSVGLDVILLGTDGWDIATMAEYPAARGAIATHQWDLELPGSTAVDFRGRYEARYGTIPRATAALTYDAVRVLVEAAMLAGTLEPHALRDAIFALPPIRGAAGTLDFVDSQDPVRDVVVSTIGEDGVRRAWRDDGGPEDGRP